MQTPKTRQARWPWVLVVVAIAGAGWWLLRPQEAPRQEAIAALPSAQDAGSSPVAAGDPSVPDDPPGIQHPIEPVAAAADAAIPALADSDATAWEALSDLVADPSVLGIVLREHLVQRLVVMVDNLTEPRVTPQTLALRVVPGPFATLDEGEVQVVDVAENAGRYAPYVAAFTQADAARMAALYRRFYPLFQQSYAELGRPDAYFNDRLVQVIDHLLQAPEPAGPLEVAPDPFGKLRFVDPSLESLSVGHKALLRLSPEQRAAVKQQLRALRAALAQG